jgi:hypothetical protein
MTTIPIEFMIIILIAILIPLLLIVHLVVIFAFVEVLIHTTKCYLCYYDKYHSNDICKDYHDNKDIIDDRECGVVCSKGEREENEKKIKGEAIGNINTLFYRGESEKEEM